MKLSDIDKILDTDRPNRGKIMKAIAWLGEQLKAQPDDVQLRRTRGQLWFVVNDLVKAWIDLNHVKHCAPEDPDSALMLARIQYAHADEVADPYEEIPQEADGSWASRSSDEVDRIYQRQCERLRFEAYGELVGLFGQHIADLNFSLHILDSLAEGGDHVPWVRYHMILRLLAAHPDAFAARRAEALFLARLGYTGIPSEQAPLGYFSDVAGTKHHAMTVDRALRCIEALLQRPEAAGDAELYRAHADLLKAFDDYEGAGKAYQRSLKLLAAERSADAATLSDLRWQIKSCTGGRAGYLRAYVAKLDEGLALAERVAGRFGGLKGGGLIDRSTLETMKVSLGGVRATLMGQLEPPSEETLRKAPLFAITTAADAAALIQLDPIQFRSIDAKGLERETSSWFAEVASQAAAAELQPLGPGSHLQSTRAPAKAVICQVWGNPERTAAVIAEWADGVPIVRILSELSDGSILMTADTRGGTCWQNDPRVDTFMVDPGTPIIQLANLHLARLAARLAIDPALTARRIDSIERLQELENHLRLYRNQFRFEQGITDVEMRGMNFFDFDFFAPLLRRETEKALAPLRTKLH